MGEWMPIERWPDCKQMERPGIVFELRNQQGQSLLSPCVPELPQAPFDWLSGPVEFRPVPELPAEHSRPIPAPRIK